MPKTKSNKKTISKTTTNLKSWIFDTPVKFALLTFIINLGVIFVYALIASIFNISSMLLLEILLGASFVWNIYYMIKKLPHDDMYRSDFIAITNACCFITVFIPLITFSVLANKLPMLRYNFMMIYLLHPVLIWVALISLALLYLYVFGVAISSVYAKYKRALKLGLSKWHIILSMPFAFLLMWTPGYLIPEKKDESKLQIQTKWFNKFNKWVLSDTSNAILVFLVLVLLRNSFSGLPALLLTLFLLVVYTLWNVKYKTNLLKDIDHGYALTAIGINIISIICVVIMFMNN